MEKEREGFPITSLREINMLLKAKHENIVFVRVSTHCQYILHRILSCTLSLSLSLSLSQEIVVGSNMDKIFIVMDYVEHDLKSLMETMKQPFLEGIKLVLTIKFTHMPSLSPGEVKTLLIQLLRAVHHLHDNWILHRDLKTSNLLLSHKGILKVH